jgi:hypothetical protein
MKALDTTATPSLKEKTDIRWKRIVLAAFLSEVAVIGVLIAAMGVYRLVAPGRSAEDYMAFGQVAGYYLAAPAAGVATFLFALWVTRPLASGFITNGVLVGVIATLLTLGFIFGARPEDRLMYIVSYLARIAAGYAAGLVANKRADQR